MDIRITPEDYEKIKMAAAKAGKPTAVWARQVMLEAAGGTSFLAERASTLIKDAQLGDLISEASTYHRWMAIRDKLEKPNDEELRALITLFPAQKHWLLTGETE